jgi:photosystem II stability/assembly factor-like uncharacterized protein
MRNKYLLLSSIFIVVLTLILFNVPFRDSFLDKNNSNSKIKPEIGNRDNPYAALEYRYNMLKGMKKYLDPLARERAVNYTKDNLLNSVLKKANTISSWTSVGPGNIGGRIRSILIRPSDSNTILVCAVAGGIWKSTNGGNSWIPKTDDQNPLSIGCMINSGDTVYAGTGEGWGNIDAVYGGGIYKSTDFGNSWTLLPGTSGSNLLNFKNVMKLAFDPDGNVYAVTETFDYSGGISHLQNNGGLYISTDGGSSWSKISNTSITNYNIGCDVIPISSSIILFATQGGGIYKTTDAGTNWSHITSGLPTSNIGRIALAQDPNSSNTIYAVLESTSNSSGLAGIYKSTDGGSTWNALTPPPLLTSTGNKSYLDGQGWYDNVIAVDPYNSSNIYVGGVDMMKSTNGGSSWFQLTYWDTYYGTPYVHADHHAITFDPSTANVVYDGDDGGIFKTTNGGNSWTELNNNLAITQFYGGAAFPTGSIYYGGTQDNGHLKFNGSGTNWTEVYGGDGGYAAIDQTNSNIAYEEYVYLQISKTTDGGSNWTSAVTGLSDAGSSSLCLFIAPFALDPENSSVLIAGSNKIWLSTNSAGNWKKSTNNALSTGNIVSAVTIVNSSSPYLGFAGTTGGKVFICSSLTGTNDTWTGITPPGNNGAWVRRIVVDLNNKQHIYVCYAGYNDDGITPTKHIFYSSNQGSSWSDVSGNLPDVPVHSLVIDPNNSQILYIGTETGVYQTTNGGTNWINTTTGMATYAPVDEIVRQTGTNNLFAFTHGRSAFVTTTPLPVELTNFSSVVNDGMVNLSWQTATESNNYGFEVERSAVNNQALTYEKIGFVSGAGNSNSPKNYSFFDQPTGGTKFSYRIKQIDYNGNYQYYDAVTVSIDGGQTAELLQNSPNPFNPSTSIKFFIPYNSDVSLKIYDMLGREITTLINGATTAGYHIVYWNGRDNYGSQAASGIYLYRLTAGNFIETKKMILLK